MTSKLLSRRDLAFLLYEWLDAESLTTRPRFADHSRETFDAALATWRSYDGCTDESTVVGVGTALTTTYSACSSGANVVGVLYGGLDHEWPTALLVGQNVAGAGKSWAFLSGSSAPSAGLGSE